MIFSTNCKAIKSSLQMIVMTLIMTKLVMMTLIMTTTTIIIQKSIYSNNYVESESLDNCPTSIFGPISNQDKWSY